MKLFKKGPLASRTPEQQQAINTCAANLCEVLGLTMQWQDRHRGFGEWRALVDAMDQYAEVPEIREV